MIALLPRHGNPVILSSSMGFMYLWHSLMEIWDFVALQKKSYRVSYPQWFITWIAFPFYPQTKRAAQTCGSLCHAVKKRPQSLWHQGILRQTARYCGLSFQDFVPLDFGMSMFCNKSRKKTPENRSFPGKKITFYRLLNSKSPKYTMLNVRRFLRFLLDFQRKSAVFRCIQLWFSCSWVDHEKLILHPTSSLCTAAQGFTGQQVRSETVCCYLIHLKIKYTYGGHT